jgi:hypothetical protein
MPDNTRNEGLTPVTGPVGGEALTQLDGVALEGFDPNRLLDGLIAKMQLENDAALANKLQVIEPIIRMIRTESLSMSQSMLFRWIQEATGIKADELNDLIKNSISRP